VGLDVNKDLIAVAVAEEGMRAEVQEELDREIARRRKNFGVRLTAGLIEFEHGVTH
jgi:hypothetical protein